MRLRKSFRGRAPKNGIGGRLATGRDRKFDDEGKGISRSCALNFEKGTSESDFGPVGFRDGEILAIKAALVP